MKYPKTPRSKDRRVKVTEKMIEVMRYLYKHGMTCKQVGAHQGVSRSCAALYIKPEQRERKNTHARTARSTWNIKKMDPEVRHKNYEYKKQVTPLMEYVAFQRKGYNNNVTNN